jgi:hypothetical protein
MNPEPSTDPAPDPLITILSELTSAVERNSELCLSIARLVAANGWETTQAMNDAAAAAKHASTAARAAEAAVNVFADQAGMLNANIELLTGEVRVALGRLSALENIGDAGRALRATLVPRGDD